MDQAGRSIGSAEYVGQRFGKAEDPLRRRARLVSGHRSAVALRVEIRTVSDVVPAEVAAELEAAEDAADAERARASLEEPGDDAPLEDVLAELGL